jgi:hypothetical protein
MYGSVRPVSSAFGIQVLKLELVVRRLYIIPKSSWTESYELFPLISFHYHTLDSYIPPLF